MKATRPVAAQRGFVELGDVEQRAVRDDFGQHHGDGLQRFDFLFVVLARGAVLHRQHAIDLAAAHDGHAEERAERVFAGFRTIGETRMAGRIAQVHRLRRLGDQTDEAFAFLHARAVDGAAVEAFGGEKFERFAGAPEIDRTHFGDHVGGDQRHKTVEARLCARLLRHDLAQAPQ